MSDRVERLRAAIEYTTHFADLMRVATPNIVEITKIEKQLREVCDAAQETLNRMLPKEKY